MDYMDLLLIRSNDQKMVYGETINFTACEPPYWSAVIASYCRMHDIKVGIYDAEVLNASIQTVIEYVSKVRPKLIGIIVTGSNLSASTQKMHGAGLLCNALKETIKAPIFMWGLHPSALAQRTLLEEQIDYVVKGEGLESIVQLTNYVNNGTGSLDSIKGLHYSVGAQLYGNNEINLLPGEQIPSPAWDLLPMQRYVPHNWHLFGNDKTPLGGVCCFSHLSWMSV